MTPNVNVSPMDEGIDTRHAEALIQQLAQTYGWDGLQDLIRRLRFEANQAALGHIVSGEQVAVKEQG